MLITTSDKSSFKENMLKKLVAKAGKIQLCSNGCCINDDGKCGWEYMKIRIITTIF